MKKTLIILLICILGLQYASSQSYSEDNKKFIYKNFTYEISEEETDSENNYKTFIKIFKQKSGETELFKSIELTDIKYDADLITFGKYIDQEKKFVLILHRYSFYILNLYNNKLLGPYKPKFYGIGQDAQSGMISDLNIIYNGRFISGYLVDDGCFLYDLTQLYQTMEVTPSTNPLYSENRVFILQQFEDKENQVFILQQLDDKEKQFGLLLNTESWKCNQKLLFKNKVIETKTHSNIINLSEEEKEEYISDYPYSYQKYTVLKEILSGNEFRFLVYDNNTGKQITLSESLQKSDEKKIYKYLNSF